MADSAYVLVGGVPIVEGTSFLTPLFAKRDSNALWYQDVNSMNEISGFLEAPASAINRMINIRTVCERSIGAAPIFGFIDEDTNVYVDTLEDLEDNLRLAFSKIRGKPHLKITIAKALNDQNLLQQATDGVDAIKADKTKRNSDSVFRSLNANNVSILVEDDFIPERTQKILKRLSRAHKTLVVGARGSGKTWILKQHKAKLEALGKKVVLVNSSSSTESLLVSLALACSQYLNDDGDTREKILGIVKRESNSIEEIGDFLLGVIFSATQPEGPISTIILDDVFSFNEGNSVKAAFSNIEVVASLFGGSSANIIASTSQVLGYGNLFPQDPTLPFARFLEGRDYEVVLVNMSVDTEADKKFMKLVFQREEMLQGLEDAQKDLLQKFLAGHNPRRKLSYLHDVIAKISDGGVVEDVLVKVHDHQLQRLLSSLSQYSGGTSKHEIFRQISQLANQIKKHEEHALSNPRLVGRLTSELPTLGFSVNPSDELSVVSALLQQGIIAHIQASRREDQKSRARFVNKQDEMWFVSRFHGSQNDDGGSQQLDLF